MYELSEQIGVSPWYWWADVPAQKHATLFIKAGTYQQGPPAVKYRGIFINDEIWEQMNLAHEYGANQIWIANVGDLKPLEIPLEFFARMAWDPRAMTKDKIAELREIQRLAKAGSTPTRQL